MYSKLLSWLLPSVLDLTDDTNDDADLVGADRKDDDDDDNVSAY